MSDPLSTHPPSPHPQDPNTDRISFQTRFDELCESIESLDIERVVLRLNEFEQTTFGQPAVVEEKEKEGEEVRPSLRGITRKFFVRTFQHSETGLNALESLLYTLVLNQEPLLEQEGEDPSLPSATDRKADTGKEQKRKTKPRHSCEFLIVLKILLAETKRNGTIGSGEEREKLVLELPKEVLELLGGEIREVLEKAGYGLECLREVGEKEKARGSMERDTDRSASKLSEKQETQLDPSRAETRSISSRSESIPQEISEEMGAHEERRESERKGRIEKEESSIPRRGSKRALSVSRDNTGVRADGESEEFSCKRKKEDRKDEQDQPQEAEEKTSSKSSTRSSLSGSPPRQPFSENVDRKSTTGRRVFGSPPRAPRSHLQPRLDHSRDPNPRSSSSSNSSSISKSSRHGCTNAGTSSRVPSPDRLSPGKTVVVKAQSSSSNRLPSIKRSPDTTSSLLPFQLPSTSTSLGKAPVNRSSRPNVSLASTSGNVFTFSLPFQMPPSPSKLRNPPIPSASPLPLVPPTRPKSSIRLPSSPSRPKISISTSRPFAIPRPPRSPFRPPSPFLPGCAPSNPTKSKSDVEEGRKRKEADRSRAKESFESLGCRYIAQPPSSSIPTAENKTERALSPDRTWLE